MNSILIVMLMLTGEPSTTSQRLEATSPNCVWEKRAVMGMNRAEGEAGTNVRYMPYCVGKM